MEQDCGVKNPDVRCRQPFCISCKAKPVVRTPDGVSVASVKKVINLAIRVKDCDGEGKDRIFAYGVEAENEHDAKSILAMQLRQVVNLLEKDVAEDKTGVGGGIA